MNNTIINGDLAAALWKGAQVLLVRPDREKKLHVLVKMPKGILSDLREDKPEIKFEYFYQDGDVFKSGTEYYSGMAWAKSRFNGEVGEIRQMQLEIEEMKKKNQQL